MDERRRGAPGGDAPEGPEDSAARNYWQNPYPAYDRLGTEPFLYRGDMPDGIECESPPDCP